jgi:hypothetical protein
MSAERLVSRAEFSRLVGVSSAAIAKAIKGCLAPAYTGRKIDTRHAAARAYARRHWSGHACSVTRDACDPSLAQLLTRIEALL